jgi:hypothetical protein
MTTTKCPAKAELEGLRKTQDVFEELDWLEFVELTRAEKDEYLFRQTHRLLRWFHILEKRTQE